MTRDARVGIGAGITGPVQLAVAQTLLRLVHVRGIEPEGRVVGAESAGPLADPALADDEGLVSVGQDLADLGPFLEGDRTVIGQQAHWSHSASGRRTIRSDTADRGSFPSKST